MTGFADTWGIHEQQFWMRGQQPAEPVRFDPHAGMWHVYGYREVARVLSDAAQFSSDMGRRAGSKNLFSEGNIVQMDPPQHTKVRKLIGGAFSPKAIARLEPRVDQLTRELLDAVSGQDRMELVADLGYPLPVIVIAELLGVPSSDRHLFKHWVDGLLQSSEQFSMTDREDERQRLIKTFVEETGHLTSYIGQHAAERRRKPREDLLTKLIEAEAGGERLSHKEVVNFAFILLLAGHITTTMLLGNTVLCLNMNPGHLELARSDPSALDAVTEESLRFFSPFAAVGRVTTSEVELGGKLIPADQLLMVWIAAANRDPLHFGQPSIFQPDRTPNPHLAFGRGNHFCPGAALARLENRIALSILLDRFPALRIDPDEPPEFNRSPNTTGVRRVPLLLT